MSSSEAATLLEIKLLEKLFFCYIMFHNTIITNNGNYFFHRLKSPITQKQIFSLADNITVYIHTHVSTKQKIKYYLMLI